MLMWTSKSNLCTVYARFGRYKGVYALWWPDGQMGDKITRSTFYRHYLLQKGEGKPSLPTPTTPKQSVLYRCPRYLRQTLRKLWLCGQRVLDCFIFPNMPHFISSLNHFVADWVGSQGSIHYFRNEKETGPSKLPKRLLGQEKMANSWPARPQLWSHKQLRDTVRLQFPSPYSSGE